MATWKLTVSGKNLRREGIDKLLGLFEKKYGEKVEVTLRKDNPPESRADRLASAKSDIEDAKGEIETLREEMEEWENGIPENLQDGDKARAVQDAIGQLEDIIHHLEQVDDMEVDFPSMMG